MDSASFLVSFRLKGSESILKRPINLSHHQLLAFLLMSIMNLVKRLQTMNVLRLSFLNADMDGGQCNLLKEGGDGCFI
jgi:hypothetical protein